MTGPRRLALVLLGGALGCGAPGMDVVALEGATLIDGSGGPAVPSAVLLVAHGHLQAVGTAASVTVPGSAVRINLAGKTIIPGLIDAHARLERWAAPRYIAWGVTTVREIAASPESAFALKTELNLGGILGPRVFSAGPAIDSGMVSAEGVRKAVDQRAVAGADFVAVGPHITATLLRPLLDEAATLRLPVAGDLGKVDALTAARAGVVANEGLSGIASAERGWIALDSAALRRLARALAAAHVTMVPMLVLHEMRSRLNDPTLLTRPTMADAPPWAASVRDAAALLRRTGWRAADLAAFRRARARQDQFVRELKRAGGAVAAGSGAADALLVPGASLHDELELLVAAGLTPLEAIDAATRQGARLLRADSLGLLAEGKVADLVVLNANPVNDIAATRDIAWVMTRGRIVYPDSVRREWPK